MDVASLLTLLLLALALAVQPWSVLAAVLLVASEGGVGKAVAYVAGWVLALTAVAVATIALYPETPKVASGSAWTSWVQIVSGVALGGWLLLRSRRRVAATSAGRPPEARPAEAQPSEAQQSQAPQSQARGAAAGPLSAQPRWMARLDSMPLLPAFGLGAFLPNYAIVVAAVGNIIASGISRAWAVVAMVLFIVMASAGVAAPLLVLVFRREQAPGIHQRWRTWLIAKGHRLMTIVLAVVAVTLIGKGLVALLACAGLGWSGLPFSGT